MADEKKETGVSRKLHDLLESVLRVAADENFFVIGCLVRAEPSPTIQVIRNSSDDPVLFMRAAATLVEKMREKNGMKSEEIQLRVN